MNRLLSTTGKVAHEEKVVQANSGTSVLHDAEKGTHAEALRGYSSNYKKEPYGCGLNCSIEAYGPCQAPYADHCDLETIRLQHPLHRFHNPGHIYMRD